MKPVDVLIALCVPAVWGMGLVVAKPAVDQFPPILLMALRFGVSALLLVWFVPIPRKILGRLALVALVGSTLQYGLSFNGLRLLDAGTTSLIVQAETPFLLIISVVWLGERLGPSKLIGILIAFAGIYVISGAPRLEGKWLGIGLALGGAAMWAIGQAMMRRVNEQNPGAMTGIGAIAWISVLATPQLLVASLLFETDHLHHLSTAGPMVWATVAYLGIVMTAIGYGCWYHVLGRYPASTAAPFLLLLPVSSVLGGWLFLGEPITPPILLGGFLVVFGVGLMTIERQRVQAAA